MAQREFTRTFVFRDDVPRWRVHYYDNSGTLVFDMNESQPMPPLSAWETCALSTMDMARLAGGVEDRPEQ